MFDIGGLELLIIAVVGLLVIGPERLPETLRSLGLWIGRLRRSFLSVKTEIEKEIGMDEVRRQLHNEAIMDQMKQIERDVRDSVDHTTDQAGKDGLADSLENKIDPRASAAPTSPATESTAELETNSANTTTPANSVEPPAEQIRPVSDAELEAAHARKQKHSAEQSQ